MSWSEQAGAVVGALLAPWFAVATALRGQRVFHPGGLLTAGSVLPLHEHPHLAPLADRLAGAALVRWSGGAHASPRAPHDLLGCAVRFRLPGPVDGQIGEDDQDLLAITTETLAGLSAATRTTDVSDYRLSTYYTLGRFTDDALGPIELRYVPRPPRSTAEGDDRHERLRAAIAQHDASFVIEVRGACTGGAWQPVVEVVLEQAFPTDPRDLAFNPFRNGRGLRPTGFVHALRRAVYPLAAARRAAR